MKRPGAEAGWGGAEMLFGLATFAGSVWAKAVILRAEQQKSRQPTRR
jgi:hypothetical protein